MAGTSCRATLSSKGQETSDELLRVLEILKSANLLLSWNKNFSEKKIDNIEESLTTHIGIKFDNPVNLIVFWRPFNYILICYLKI